MVMGGDGHAWLWGAGAWLQGGMHGCRGVACVVVVGHAWLQGGVCGCRGACVVVGGGDSGMRGGGGACVG